MVALSESTLDAANNRSYIYWTAYLIERVSSPSTNASGVSGSVALAGAGTVWAGSFSFSWAGAGLQSTLVASGEGWHGRNPDGSGEAAIGFTMGDTGTSGAGGPSYVGLTVPLAKLTSLPPAPTGLTATRVSDTQVNLAWTQTGGGTNAAPTYHIIQRRLNQPAGIGTEAGWDSGTTILATTAAQVNVSPNEKWEYRVWSYNAAGQRVSNISAPVYTTPAAPISAAAAKNSSNDIIVTFTPKVGYAEHNHEVWHGTVSGGVTTWDGAALATLASGVATYTHVAPNSAQVHIYRVRATAGALASGYSTTSAVQLLAAPNKPTIPATPQFADKALAFTYAWVHNSVDTSPQQYYEVGYSTNGGAAWSTTGKVTSAVAQRIFAASSYAANVALTLRVRTWGSATTGGSDGTGASPWSDLVTVTFKTRPTTTITAPGNGSTINDSTVRANLTFAQAEGATFVKAELRLSRTTGGTVVLEDLETTQLIGTALATPVANTTAYTLRARVLDSNGIWSDYVTNAFSVSYLAPVPAVMTLTYLPDMGYTQIGITIADPIAGQSAAVSVTITRSINGGPEETIVQDYPAAAILTVMDTLPSINGSNRYTITTKSAQGSQTVSQGTLVTSECRRAFLSKGSGFDTVVAFGGNLKVSDGLSVASATVAAAGRIKPIGLYGVETSVQVKVSSRIFEGFGSTMEQVRSFLLIPGKACFRDASGRRTFGSVKGSVAYEKKTRGDLSFTLTETS